MRATKGGLRLQWHVPEVLNRIAGDLVRDGGFRVEGEGNCGRNSVFGRLRSAPLEIRLAMWIFASKEG